MKHNFAKLSVWKESRLFVKNIYSISAKFPDNEKFGLTSQIRRAAVSIPSNISEGCGRGTNRQLAHFLDIAIGSSCEVETQLYLAFDLYFISEIELNQLVAAVTEIRRMILGFKRSLV